MGAIWARIWGEGMFRDEQLESPGEHAGRDVLFILVCEGNVGPVELVLDTFTGATGARRGRRSGGTIESECQIQKRGW